MRRCVFFDRDGVVNRSPGPDAYVLDWSAFHLQPAFVAAALVAKARGYSLAVASNQRSVALGLVTHAGVVGLHLRLRAFLRQAYGLDLLEIAFCPHEQADLCLCRKPKPGMLIDMARRHDLDLRASWMIGDAERDVEAGLRAGCRTILIGHETEASCAHHRARDISVLPGLLKTVLNKKVAAL